MLWNRNSAEGSAHVRFIEVSNCLVAECFQSRFQQFRVGVEVNVLADPRQTLGWMAGIFRKGNA